MRFTSLGSVLVFVAGAALFVACSSSDEAGTGGDGDSPSGGTEGDGDSGDGDSGDGDSGDGDSGDGDSGDGDSGDGDSGDGDSMGGASSGGSNSGGTNTGGTVSTGGSSASGGNGSGGEPAVDTFRVDMNFHADDATCAAAADYTMGADFDAGTCYSGAEVKMRVNDATPGIPGPAQSLLNSVFTDSAYFTFSCAGTSPSMMRYMTEGCDENGFVINADMCAFVTNVGPTSVYSRQQCSRE